MAASQPQAGGRRDSVHCSSSSIRASELKDLKVQQHLHLNGDEHGMEDANPVLQKLQKWADYPSYGTSVAATKFLPMKTPMSTEIIDSWSLPTPPQHVLTIPGLLAEQRAIGRTIGLIIDLSNHDTLYAEDLAEQKGLEYAHIQLVAKAFPGRASINQVIKTARSYWRAHPDSYIAIHCAYGFNRTGFVVCAYLVQELGMSVQQALASFAAARPPGVKHEKFVVELHRRYGQRLAPVPPTPDPEPADGSSDAAREEAAHGSYRAVSSSLPRGSGRVGSSMGHATPGGADEGGSAHSSVAGRSPQTDPGSSLTGGSPPAAQQPQPQQQHARPKLIRLYPDAGEATPWEPGTPSRETCAATQQVWDALARGGPAAAYRVRTASELSIAGSADGGGCWPEGAYSSMEASDGRISCSSVFSEFGAVAAHLEERYPGLAAARSTMRPLPPRSTTSEASTLEDPSQHAAALGAARFSFGSAASDARGINGARASQDIGNDAADAAAAPVLAQLPEPALAHARAGDASDGSSAADLLSGSRDGEAGGADAGSPGGERRVLQPELLSASLAAQDRSPRGEEQGASAPGGAAGGRQGAGAAPVLAHAPVSSPSSEAWRACLDDHPHSRGGSREHMLALQRSSHSSGSSCSRTESAHSLVNNESLGLDEREVFENFNKLGLSARRRKARVAAGAPEVDPAQAGRMSIQDLQRGVPSSPVLASHGLEDAQFQLDTDASSPGVVADLATTSSDVHGAAPTTPFAVAAVQVGSLSARSGGLGEAGSGADHTHAAQQTGASDRRPSLQLGVKQHKRGRCSLM